MANVGSRLGNDSAGQGRRWCSRAWRHACAVRLRSNAEGRGGGAGRTGRRLRGASGGEPASLLDFKSGQYAPPVRRVHIPKGDYRDSDRQGAAPVVMVLESVRAGRDVAGPSWALGSSGPAASLGADDGRGRVIDGHPGLFRCPGPQSSVAFWTGGYATACGRAIDKCSGGSAGGHRSVLGTPQGGVVSPLLAIYLHHVLDVWFTTEVQPRLRGRSVLSAMRTTWSSSTV